MGDIDIANGDDRSFSVGWWRMPFPLPARRLRQLILLKRLFVKALLPLVSLRAILPP
jgi:hypothetical protein